MIEENSDAAALAALEVVINERRMYLKGYEKPSEPVAYETLRTLDDLFCRDLMEPSRVVDKDEQWFRSIATWGVNQALRRVIPRSAKSGPFRNFPSKKENHVKADDFIFNCGALCLAERSKDWLQEGLLSGKLRLRPNQRTIKSIIELKEANVSCFSEQIGISGLQWSSAQVWKQDRPREIALETRHPEFDPKLRRLVSLENNWHMTYSTTPEIDDYFHEWAKLYLRRIFSQDMIGNDDVIGGRPFSRYVEVLTALSARSQKHIAFAAILRAKHPAAHIRNLLTTFSHRRFFIEILARYMDADMQEIEAIMKHLTLSGKNLDWHTKGEDAAWAPLVQASGQYLILPTYGIDINPFLFLLNELRYRHEADWFKVANNRERRWLEELCMLFSGPSWRVNSRNVKLRKNGKNVTDIDFAIYEVETNELALFQLKWQQPVGSDNRMRRSSGKNLVNDSNRWIDVVIAWIEAEGVNELMSRLGFQHKSEPVISFFVLGRYHAHFSGFDEQDRRAVWADWAHFRRVCAEENTPSPSRLVSALRIIIEQSRSRKRSDVAAFPIGETAIVFKASNG